MDYDRNIVDEQRRWQKNNKPIGWKKYIYIYSKIQYDL